MFLIAVAIGIAVSAFLPWVEVSAGLFSVTKAGIDGDGAITLVIALLIGASVVAFVYGQLAERSMLFIAAIGGVIITAIGVHDWSSLPEASGSASISPGIGLVLTTIGGLLLTFAAGIRLRRPATS